MKQVRKITSMLTQLFRICAPWLSDHRKGDHPLLIHQNMLKSRRRGYVLCCKIFQSPQIESLFLSDTILAPISGFDLKDISLVSILLSRIKDDIGNKESYITFISWNISNLKTFRKVLRFFFISQVSLNNTTYKVRRTKSSPCIQSCNCHVRKLLGVNIIPFFPKNACSKNIGVSPNPCKIAKLETHPRTILISPTAEETSRNQYHCCFKRDQNFEVKLKKEFSALRNTAFNSAHASHLKGRVSHLEMNLWSPCL